MLKLLIILLFAINLFSQNTQTSKNPKPYTAIGDEIYNNVEKIQKLKEIKHYNIFKEKINEYVSKTEEIKEFGFKVESGEKSDFKLKYLKDIRELLKTNDYFLRTVKNDFFLSLKNNDIKLFENTVNSGLVDIKKNKSKILKFYKQHSKEIDDRGIIKTLVDNERKKHKKKYKRKTKKDVQAQKIKRIRKNDKIKEKELEEKLAKELKITKENIRKEQEKELFN